MYIVIEYTVGICGLFYYIIFYFINPSMNCEYAHVGKLSVFLKTCSSVP
jgi:hypothetical protein